MQTLLRGTGNLIYNGCVVALKDEFSTTVKTVFAPRYQEFDGQSTNNSVYFRSVLKWICETYPKHTNFSFFVNVNPNSMGLAMVNIYSTDAVDSNGIPQYSSGIYVPLGDNNVIYKFGTYEYGFHFRNIVGSPEFSLSETTLTITT